jgi:hypothetical protein
MGMSERTKKRDREKRYDLPMLNRMLFNPLLERNTIYKLADDIRGRSIRRVIIVYFKDMRVLKTSDGGRFL